MSEEIRARFDAHAEAYRDWWGPIIKPAALRLLDRVPAAALAGQPTILDVGTGTGALALAAAQRWPAATVIGVDPSRAMLDIGADAAERDGVAGRVRFEVGEGARLPLDDRSVDVAVSSFVIQLVPSRLDMLREILRVLRPGGIFANVSWLVDDRPFEPDDAFDDALDELDLPDEADDRPEPDPYPSVRAADREFRRAGFRHVRAMPELLDHLFSAESYLGLLEHWSASERFDGLDADTRDRLRAVALEHLGRLPAGAFRWRAELVSVVAERG